MSDTEQKKNPASSRKLKKLRGEGTIATAQDTAAFAGMVAAVVTSLFVFNIVEFEFGVMFEAIVNPAGGTFEERASDSISSALRWLGIAVLPIMTAAIAAAVVTMIIYNKGLTFSMKPVTPNLSRISIKAGVQRIFGLRGWVELAQGLARVVLWLVISGIWTWLFLPELVNMARCSLACQLDMAMTHFGFLLAAMILLMVVTGLLDMGLQKFLFLNEQRMTDTETKREQKEQVGSQEVRQERKRLHKELLSGAEHAGVERANMCFFDGDTAVALRYHPEHSPLPRVSAVARTADRSAELRDKIRQNGFPEAENTKIVRSCISKAPGEGIDEDIFKDLAIAMKRMFG